LGFEVRAVDSSIANPHYKVKLSDSLELLCFSKKYNDEQNPSGDFIALMTCDDADQKCPFIPGARLRVALKYNDPKIFDGTAQQLEGYVERIKQIATEQLFLFSLLNNN
jgi:hypothetical protein